MSAVALKPPSLEAHLALANLERRAGRLAQMRLAYERGVAALRGAPLAYFARHAARVERVLCSEPSRGAEIFAEIFAEVFAEMRRSALNSANYLC